MSKEVLVIHRALAPYRVDFFKVINDNCSAEIIFLLRNLQQANYQQHYLVDKLGGKPEYLTQGLNLGRRVLYRRGLLKKVLNFGGSYIVLYEFGPLTLYLVLMSLVFRKKIQIIIMTDDSVDVLAKSGILRKLSRKLILLNTRGIICSSSRVSQFFKKKSIRTIYFPIIQNENRPEFKSSKTRRDLDFLYVGRFSPEKNVIGLLDAFHDYQSCNSVNTNLTLVGDGPQLAEVRQRIEALSLSDSVSLLGWMEGEELYSIYRKSKYLVLPSLTERFGAVVNEALIFGLAVMCSSKAGASELINFNNGVVFDPSDHAGFVNSFVEVRSKYMGGNGMPMLFSDFTNDLLNLLNCNRDF